MPSERGPHAATWISWPAGEALWEGVLEPVRDEVTALVRTLARFEPVVVNVGDAAAEADARRRLADAGVPDGAVAMHRVPMDDAWLRDNGPLFVVNESGALAATDWRFDGWGGTYAAARDDRVPTAIAETLGIPRFAYDAVLEGGAIEVDDDGTVLTTRTCLLDGVRNPGLDEPGYAALLAEGLGASRLAWLKGGLVDDHTDGHVDTVARFADDGAVLCVTADEDDEDNAATLAANRARLAELGRPGGGRYEILELPLPQDRSRRGGVRPPRSYANFCLVNGGIVVPTFGDPRDGEALEILAAAFPGREVVGLGAVNLVTGGGGFHCLTQHQPKGDRE
ncbi:MAG: agmatine deiminase [Deinococcus-Thermus bacterium]|jgi:agmatine deiminase|nr:agmatine deiminase [Deinococcota bacterium]